MLEERASEHGLLAFALVYLTFFLDNVLLTVLVPIIPDWVRGESLALWATHDAPLVKFLNTTVNKITTADEDEGVGGSQALVGAVLGAKAAAQLLMAPVAACAVARRGPVPVLRAATALLATAAAGVLVGYPFGGSAYVLWSPAAPFQLICFALLLDLVLQYAFLREDGEYQIQCNQENNKQARPESMWAVSRRGGALECAGAVLLTTSVMAALEPCLPLWMLEKFRPERWQTGAAFLPDSLGYLIATSSLGGVTRLVGAERVALVGQITVGVAALAVPYATSVWGLATPQLCVGVGLGATDAALAPALLARRPRRVPQLAALLQAAASAAYALVGSLRSRNIMIDIKPKM
ncbi:PREDICTED: chromaffin granule amine transporter-like [Papilio xuthus]|uniref:Chromaffin granule amine transporter-like n=1 Tax=Papilio xuthus TaxID=66420 RepID=A0AAJ6ZAV3_PAPXU|nr:PREDICTED: chromaffin granule amine transporter-like [Papilio xuthus]